MWEHVFGTDMRTQQDFDLVQRLLGNGLSDREIGHRTGVPRATIRTWRRRPYRVRRLLAPPPDDWRPADEWAYSYLLGLYLGDGHIVVSPSHAAVLRLYLDAQYSGIIQSAEGAMSRVAPGIPVRRCARPGSTCVSASATLWPVAFPQHGPGRKHERVIELVDWQRDLTARHPKALLRGLVHSDGCRCVNRFTIRLPKGGDREYAYVRYFFSNHSLGIQRIFSSHCELLGIRWTQSRRFMLSVSDRASVAILDSFIGPKA